MNPEQGWSSPSGSSEPPAGVHVEVEPPDGPPPPPFVRRRRRRRSVVLVVVAALLVVGIPVGLSLAGWLAQDESPEVAADGDDDGSEAAPDAGPAPEGTLEPPDLDALDGVDAAYGRLLIDIDASERAMIGFQDDLTDAFRSPGDDPDALFQQLSEAAGERRVQLLEVRDRLAEELPDPGAEDVRAIYLEHLDSWSEYMDAIEADPALLFEETDRSGHTVAINATADAFARSLEEQLPEDADEHVRRFADGILDRGFRSEGDSQV